MDTKFAAAAMSLRPVCIWAKGVGTLIPFGGNIYTYASTLLLFFDTVHHRTLPAIETIVRKLIALQVAKP